MTLKIYIHISKSMYSCYVSTNNQSLSYRDFYDLQTGQNPPPSTVATRLTILPFRHLVKAQSYVHSVANTSRYTAISSVCSRQTDLPCARDLVNLTTVTKLVQASLTSWGEWKTFRRTERITRHWGNKVKQPLYANSM